MYIYTHVYRLIYIYICIYIYALYFYGLGVPVGGKTAQISLPSGKIQNHTKITRTNSSTDGSESSIRCVDKYVHI
jgi:hypothetical protein